jgi:hypothetical protein
VAEQVSAEMVANVHSVAVAAGEVVGPLFSWEPQQPSPGGAELTVVRAAGGMRSVPGQSRVGSWDSSRDHPCPLEELRRVHWKTNWVSRGSVASWSPTVAG